MVEPLTLFGGHNLREMLDSDMSFLSYKLRVGYANQLNPLRNDLRGVRDRLGQVSEKQLGVADDAADRAAV